MFHHSSNPATSDSGSHVSNHRAGSLTTKENMRPFGNVDVPIHNEYSGSENSNQASSHSHPHTDPSNNKHSNYSIF